MRRSRPALLAVLTALALPAAAVAQSPMQFSAGDAALFKLYEEFSRTQTISACKTSLSTLRAAEGKLTPSVDQYAPRLRTLITSAIAKHEAGDCGGSKSSGSSGSNGSSGSSGSGGSSGSSGSGGSLGSSGSGGSSGSSGSNGSSGSSGSNGSSGGARTTTTPPSTATATTPAAVAPVPTTPARGGPVPAPGATLDPSAAAADGAIGAAADRATPGDGDGGTPAPIVILAVLAVIAVLGGAVYGLARWWALDPRWWQRTRHASSEAGWRASAAWAEFADWMRLGR